MADQPNVPFNRYQTLDFVRAVCDAGRERDSALYTGNDDNIVIDLLTRYVIETPNGAKSARRSAAFSVIGLSGPKRPEKQFAIAGPEIG